MSDEFLLEFEVAVVRRFEALLPADEARAVVEEWGAGETMVMNSPRDALGFVELWTEGKTVMRLGPLFLGADPEYVESIRGELPDEIVGLVDWSRLGLIVQDWVAGQTPDVRAGIADVEIVVDPCDSDGFFRLRIGGRVVARVHYSRLLPGAPLEGKHRWKRGETEGGYL